MKKVLSVILACVFAFSVMIPCFSLDLSRAVKVVDPETASPVLLPSSVSTIKVGSWPQTQITEEGEIDRLSHLLESPDLVWTDDALPNGDHIVYTDVDDGTTRYRFVRTDDDEKLWFRWEPLSWDRMDYHGYTIWVCQSVVFTVKNTADVFRCWLTDTFYRLAFTRAEQESWLISAPTYGITQNRTASVGAYAQLYRATGRNYYQRVLPTAFGSDDVTGSPITSRRIGVRPIITSAAHSHEQTVRLVRDRGASWIRCLLCWLFH